MPEVQIHKSHDGRVVAAVGWMAEPHLAAIVTQDTGQIGWTLQFSAEAGAYLRALVDHSVVLGRYLRLSRWQEHSLVH